MLHDVKNDVERIRSFISTELWTMDLEEVPKSRRTGLRFLKVGYVVLQGFVKDKCSLQASALTFITLMSLVPFLAITMSIAKGMGFAPKLQQEFVGLAEGIPQVQLWIKQLMTLVQETNFLALGAIGVALLVVIVIKVMAQIEDSMNAIWGVRESRPWLRKFSDYLSVLFVVPFMFLLVTSVNAGLRSASVVAFTQELTGSFFWLYGLLLQFMGFAGVVAALHFVYVFMPNTRVRWRSALVGALCAGLTWLLWQKFCINFQFWVTKYNKIYGTFASLPVALYWLNVNWMIILLGAEICFSCQHYRTYVLEQESDKVSQGLKRRLAFRIMYEIARIFRSGQGYWEPIKFQEKHKIPVRLVNEILLVMKEHKLIVEVAGADSWIPAREIGKITMADIELALRGPIAGMFQHVGRVPDSLSKILMEHEKDYFDDLSNRSFADLLDAEEHTKEVKVSLDESEPAD